MDAHPLGFHRHRVHDRLVFDKLVLVFGCAYERIITKTPSGGEMAGENSLDRGKRDIKRFTLVDANGIPLGTVTRRSWMRPWAPRRRSERWPSR